MSDQLYNQTIVVYDQKTNGIICNANSDSHASAITLGNPNAKFTAINRDINPDCDKFDYNDIHVHYQIGLHNFYISLLDPIFVNDEWIQSRTLTLEKSRSLAHWEFSVRQHLSRVNDFFGWPSVLPFLTDQLLQCDPKNDYYTKAITEWGEIQDISPSAAYQELTIRQQGHGLVYLRRHALYLKYVRSISSAKTIEEVKHQSTLASYSLPRIVR